MRIASLTSSINVPSTWQIYSFSRFLSNVLICSRSTTEFFTSRYFFALISMCVGSFALFILDVIAKAKANTMPNDTIDRNIKKAAGEGSGDNYEHITYEGYGPNGTAIIVKTLTDNKNRTASNVRNAFTKGSGNVGTPGCVSFMFDEKGQIIVAKEDCDMDADELMMMALDFGAEDFSEEEESFEILTAPEDFSEVRLKLEEAGIVMADAEVTMIPQTYVELTSEEDIKNIQKTLDLLDEDDDVQDVYHNWDE